MARTGRKRKTGIREPNGRISRSLVKPADPMAVARAARENVLGVRKQDSGTDLAGTAVGRLFLRGLLSRRDVDASKAFCERWEAYALAIDLGAVEPRAVDLNRVHGRAYREMSRPQAERAIARWDEVVFALDVAGKRGQLYAIVYDATIRDREPKTAWLLAFGLGLVADKIGLPIANGGEAA